MSVLEILLIAIGMSLDIFGYIISQSVSYARLDKKKLCLYSLTFAIWEFISLLLGYLSVKILRLFWISDSKVQELYLIAVAIMIIITIRMFLVGIHRENIIEHRMDDVQLLKLMHDYMNVGLRTYLMGFAFAACNTNFIVELMILMVIGITMVILGLYTGYRYGYGLRNKVYFLSSILLFVADVSICVRYIDI